MADLTPHIPSESNRQSEFSVSLRIRPDILSLILRQSPNNAVQVDASRH